MPARDWIIRAKGYLATADAAVSGPEPYAPAIGFLSWQASEDALKALAEGHSIPYSHNLGNVMEHLRDNSILDSKTHTVLLQSVVTVTMSGSYNSLRYPEANPQYWENMSVEEARLRVEAARQIVRICEAKSSSRPW